MAAMPAADNSGVPADCAMSHRAMSSAVVIRPSEPSTNRFGSVAATGLPKAYTCPRGRSSPGARLIAVLDRMPNGSST